MAKKYRPKLFFLTGRLKWLGLPENWERPENEADYEAQIKYADFLADADLEANGLAKAETVKQDLQVLKRHLLEPFFRSSQKAKHFQNDYFRQQWVLLVGTFVTSLIAAITIILGPASASASVNGVTGLPTTEAAKVAGVITAIVAFITGIVTYLNQSERPQYNWYLWRTVTEELRRHYFLYLAHLPPYNVADSADVLEHNAVQIETQQDGQPPAAEEGTPRPPHAEADAEALIKLYRAKRVQVQSDYYEARMAEDRNNARFVAFWGVVVVGLATLLSTLNAAEGRQEIVLIVALLPVVAALLASFDKIYGWGRQMVLYEDAFKRLSIDNTIPPVEGHKPSRPYADVLIDYVSSVENTLKAEMSQWGQSVLKDNSNVASLSAQETLEMALAKSNLPKEQMENIRSMFRGQ